MNDLSPNGILSLTRGDTCLFPLFLNAGTDQQPIRYVLHDTVVGGQIIGTDEVFVAIEEPNQRFEDARVKQKYTKKNLNRYGDVVIVFSHEDTKCLLPGKYYYEIKAKFIKRLTDIDNDSYGVFYTFENGELVQKILPQEYNPNSIYFDIVVNTVTPRRELYIEE